MAFKNVVRVRAGLSGMSDCILHLPQVYLRDLKKFLCRENVRASIRFGAEYSEGKCYSRKKAGQEHEFRAKYTVIFIKKIGFWSLWRPFSALGRLHRFQDHGRTTPELWGRRGHRNVFFEGIQAFRYSCSMFEGRSDGTG